jgi:putative peptidoglycan lipid II flippase
MVGVVFVGMGEVLSQLLFSYERFFLPGLAASVANLVVGLGILSLGHTYGVYGLVLLVIAASACQFTLQLVFLREKIRFYAPKVDFRHSHMAELNKLSAPLLLSVGGTQLAMMTDRIFASLLPVGNLSALMYAVRLFRVPTDFLTDALQQATFPHFARLSAEQDFPTFSRHLFRYLRFVLSLTVPAAVGIVVLADLIVSVVYQRGAFDETSAHLTTQALMAYALGLPAISLMKILNRTFFSLKNTQTPTVMTIARMVMKAVLCWVLIQPLAHVGIALAESLSQSLRVLLLFFSLPNRVKGTQGRETLLSFVYILAASLLMGSGIYYLKQIVDGLINPLLELVLLIVVGAILYLAAIMMVQKEELLAFLKQLRAGSATS